MFLDKLYGPLEANSVWYKYKLEVWQEESPQSEAIHNVMRTLRAIHAQDDLNYLSCPITTGIFYHELLKEKGQLTREDKINIMTRNYNYSHNIINSYKGRGITPVLLPADLVPARQTWSQSHFMALWLSIIAEKATTVYMADGWQYSTGCCQELLHVFQLKLGLPKHSQLIFFNTKESEEFERERMKSIKVKSELGRTLSLEEGLNRIQTARDYLQRQKLPTTDHQVCINQLEWTKTQLDQGFYQ